MTPQHDRSVAAARRPELLAPAGDRVCVTAAVENGADAVYFGLECGFNARARAANLSLDSLPELMGYLQERGVRGFVTLNTLVFPSELRAIERVVVQLTEAGVDAVLVQDLGLVRLIRAVSPDLAVHASTQMTLTSGECIRVAAELGVARVVLPRELSVDEIRAVREKVDVELEVFVHGALCVAYSGQCLTSEALGGRSANRGQCAQACRLPYTLVCDDRDIDLGDVKYLLSPQDLAAYPLLPQLIEAGVNAFKIEGRLKTPEYVANITSHYRRAIDAAVDARPLEFTDRDVTEMELSFSRGFSPGWLGGCDHKMLVPGLSSAKRGVFLGTVRQVQGRRVLVDARLEVAPGDGIVFEGDRAESDEQGGRVFDVVPRGKCIELGFGRGTIELRRLWIGQKIWKTDDPHLTARLRKSFTGNRVHRRVPLNLNVAAIVGQRLEITGQAANGARCHVVSDEPLVAATRHPLTPEVIREQLGRLGNSVYELRDLSAGIKGGPMVPLSVLGQMRKEMIAQLAASWPAAPHRRIDRSPEISAHATQASEAPAVLRVLARTTEQLDTLISCGVGSVLVDFSDIRQYRQAVLKARGADVEIFLATPRIQKPDEMGIFHALAKYGSDGLVVRNLAGIAFCREHHLRFVADYSLNAANQWTVDYLRRLGAERVTASYDLNRDQLLDLVAAIPSDWLDVVIHQHMPMFHMEHCVFCAVLSPGTNKTNCGRPCDVHRVRLRDRAGMEHTLEADVGCRNTLYNATAQSAAEIVPLLLERGVRNFRIELLDESADEIRNTISLYRDVLAGRITGRQVWHRLRAANRVGVTRGTLEERRNPLAIL